MRNICIATSTRADWGLLSPLAEELRGRHDVNLQILATNMHLLDQYGHTVDEIESQGFVVDARVPMECTDATAQARVKAMSQCMAGTAAALGKLKPDILVILGDRYEMLAVASAAAIMKVPIAHIAGGEISEGAIDDNLRHAITKLASLHFTATEAYRQRVVQMGEQPKNVINAGALGVWNIMHHELWSLDELNESLGTDFREGKFILATYHPATLDTEDVADRCADFIKALSQFMPEYKILLTYPNNDEGSEEIIYQITKFADANPNKVKLVKSLGMVRYLAAVKHSAMVVGNSSSGIVEVPSLGVPTINIGMRQQGRISAQSVIHVNDDSRSIVAGMMQALYFKDFAKDCHNPYFKPDTVNIIVDKLVECNLNNLLPKHFFDLQQ